MRRDLAEYRRQIRRHIAMQLIVVALGTPLLIVIAFAAVVRRAS